MCFGGGGSQNQTTTTHFEPPEWTTSNPNGNWTDYVNRGSQIASLYGNNPHLIYGNDGQPMVAQMSNLQNQAANGFYGLASQGNPNDVLASGYLANMLNGGVQNIQPNNPYMGESPQFQAMLDAQNKDITDAYGRGTAAQTDAAAARSGAFGGSAYNEATQNNQKTLANAIAQNEATQRNQQFNNSANLAENQINRNWQGFENAANRNLQGIQQIGQMGNNDLARWNAVMGAGDLQQQTQQNNINAAQGLFNANVNWPMQMEQFYGDILQRASGQGGSSMSSTSLPGYSPVMNGLGLLGAGYGMFGGGGK
jgi:hypothetical protein